MSVKNILITNGLTSLALRIKKLLPENYTTFLGDSNAIPTIVNNQFIKLPDPKSSSYLHELLKIAIDNAITYIVPLNKIEISKLSQSLQLFEEYGVRILLPEVNTIPTITILENPEKNIELILLVDGMNLLNGQQTSLNTTGLGTVSDSGIDFALITA